MFLLLVEIGDLKFPLKNYLIITKMLFIKNKSYNEFFILKYKIQFS